MDVERENWTTSHDIKRRYRSADFLGDNRVIFDIKGNSYRLVVKIRYQNGLVVVEMGRNTCRGTTKKSSKRMCGATKRQVEMAMNVKIIKNAEDYEAAMSRLSALMSLDLKANSKEEEMN